MRPRKKDRSFLTMAAVAATGGIMAIVFAIGFPIWAVHEGRPYTPAFSLFAAWGLAALAGAWACLNTYFLSDKPLPPPPRGGVRLEFRQRTVAEPVQASNPNTTHGRAA
jgi:hypothetical protein